MSRQKINIITKKNDLVKTERQLYINFIFYYTQIDRVLLLCTSVATNSFYSIDYMTNKFSENIYYEERLFKTFHYFSFICFIKLNYKPEEEISHKFKKPVNKIEIKIIFHFVINYFFLFNTIKSTFLINDLIIK